MSQFPKTDEEKELSKICQKTGRIWFITKDDKTFVSYPDGRVSIRYENTATAIEREKEDYCR
jgi:hypothetical protein